MKRDLVRLEQQPFDLVVVGGGIYGACIARDAALRGLSVALLEQGDFGQATSANSLKIIHGGLRYLQDGNPRLVRLMARERTAWLRIAPHLVQPLPCLMPTTRQLSRSRLIMAAGVRLNDALTYDRNREMEAAQEIPAARLLSRDEFLRLLPSVPAEGVTGGVLWHDAQVTNTERLLLAVLASAAAAGAALANYVEVTGLLRSGDVVSGVAARDKLSGEELVVRAQLVLLCAGGWTGSLLERFGLPQKEEAPQPSLAINIVTRQLSADYAFALPVTSAPEAAGVRAPRTLFVVPWRQYSIIGTLHRPWQAGHEPCSAVDEDTVAGFLTAINTAYPAARLTLADVRHVHAGFLPAYAGNGPESDVRLLRESQIVDHQESDGINGLVTVHGVKYTTARHTAEQVVDLALQKLDRERQPCITDQVPVDGGEIGQLKAFLSRTEQRAPGWLSQESLRHLASNYGARLERILLCAEENPAWRRPVSSESPVLAAEIVHAMREEMALKLADVVLRRTILGAAGPPAMPVVESCAAVMAELRGWSDRQCREEIDDVYASCWQSAHEREAIAV
jgi:glycerol-3-phosphate dehydrogenase